MRASAAGSFCRGEEEGVFSAKKKWRNGGGRKIGRRREFLEQKKWRRN